MAHQKIFRFRLYPSNEQKKMLEKQMDLLCHTYNKLLEMKREQYKQNKKSLTEYDLNKHIRQITDTRDVHSQSLQNISKRISEGYKLFFALRKQGVKKAGLPRFKKREDYKSITYPQPQALFRDNKLIVPKVGLIEIRQHRKLLGRTKTLTIKKLPTGKWFACFVQNCDREYDILPKTGKVVGIDLGLNHFIATSDNELFEHPKPLARIEKRRKMLNKRFSKKEKGSRNKNKARLRLARLEERISNIRENYNWQVANYLVKNYDGICIEKLHIKNMMQNHHLAKAITDVSWGDFVGKLSYKAESAGRKLIEVNPRNTSQECHNCGAIVKKELWNRTHKCKCGIEMDRDINSAKVILNKGLLPEWQDVKPVEMIPLQTTHRIGLQELSRKQEDSSAMAVGSHLNC